MSTSTSRPMVAVGVDDTSESIEALRYAAAVAGDRHWDLQVVHAYQIPSASRRSPRRSSTTSERRRRPGSTTPCPGCVSARRPESTVWSLPESPIMLLRDVSAWASMLVLGRHHVGLLDTMLTGRVGAAVARHATCPVVIVPPGWSRANHDGRPVVVALDGETSAQSALHVACEEAELRRTPLVAMHAVPLHSKTSP